MPLPLPEHGLNQPADRVQRRRHPNGIRHGLSPLIFRFANHQNADSATTPLLGRVRRQKLGLRWYLPRIWNDVAGLASATRRRARAAMAAFAKSWRREYTAAQMVCEGYHLEHACDRTGAEREAIVFELRSLEAVLEKVEAEAAVPSALTLEDLRQLAFSAATEPSQAPSQGIRNVYQRSRMSGYTSWR